MNRYEEIKEEVNRAYEELKKKEKSKPKNQLILESLNSTIINAERYLLRHTTFSQLVRSNISFSQLCGTFVFDYSILLFEKIILEINHFWENNKDSININYFLHIIENNRQKFIEDSKWEIAQKQIQDHRTEIETAKITYESVIKFRDWKLAHKDKKELGNRFENAPNDITIELLAEIINMLKKIVDYYYDLFKFDNRETLEKMLVVEESIGFKTGLEDLVCVVNQSFEKLNFTNPEIQSIADNHKTLKLLNID
jgi:hypothetical protein